MSTNGPVTVVLADDDDNIRAALRSLFDAAQDIEVVAEGASAAEAVAACEAHTPHVAVLDLHMPGGGFVAARKITGAGDAASTKVVMLTADDTPAARAGAAANGATRFVVKSDGDDLVQTVLQVAGR